MSKRFLLCLGAAFLLLQVPAHAADYFCGGEVPKPGETTYSTFTPPDQPETACVTSKTVQVERHKRGRVWADDDCTVTVTYAVSTNCFSKKK